MKELTEASGKFVLLAKMLKKLKAQGHRVLIFSQVCVKIFKHVSFSEWFHVNSKEFPGNLLVSRAKHLARYSFEPSLALA